MNTKGGDNLSFIILIFCFISSVFAAETTTGGDFPFEKVEAEVRKLPFLGSELRGEKTPAENLIGTIDIVDDGLKVVATLSCTGAVCRIGWMTSLFLEKAQIVASNWVIRGSELTPGMPILNTQVKLEPFARFIAESKLHLWLETQKNRFDDHTLEKNRRTLVEAAVEGFYQLHLLDNTVLGSPLRNRLIAEISSVFANPSELNRVIDFVESTKEFEETSLAKQRAFLRSKKGFNAKVPPSFGPAQGAVLNLSHLGQYYARIPLRTMQLASKAAEYLPGGKGIHSAALLVCKGIACSLNAPMLPVENLARSTDGGIRNFMKRYREDLAKRFGTDTVGLPSPSEFYARYKEDLNRRFPPKLGTLPLSCQEVLATPQLAR